MCSRDVQGDDEGLSCVAYDHVHSAAGRLVAEAGVG